MRLDRHATSLLVVVGALALAGCGSDDDSGGGGSGGAAGTGAGGSGGGSAGVGGSGGGAIVPIEAPNEKWTWVDVPGSACANGSQTGFAVNLTDRSDKVAFHLMGGGACWDSLTCDNLQTAVFLDGFPKEAFDTQAGGLTAQGMFNRDEPTNPFRDYNQIFVPYCTGDVHSGSNPNGPTGKSFLGYENFGLYLKYVTATLENPSQVVVTGSSAGGFGALTNFNRVVESFPRSEVLLLDDSGPPMRPMWLTENMQNLTMRDAWSMEQNLPEECPDVKVGAVHNIYDCWSKLYPEARMGLIATLRDSTILSFYTFGNPGLTSAELENGTNDIADTLLAPHDNWHVYFFPGSGHTYLMSGKIDKGPIDGVLLTDWIQAFLDDDPSWRDVRPPPG